MGKSLRETMREEKDAKRNPIIMGNWLYSRPHIHSCLKHQLTDVKQQAE